MLLCLVLQVYTCYGRLERKRDRKDEENNISGEKAASHRDQHYFDRDQLKVREFGFNERSRSSLSLIAINLSDRDQAFSDRDQEAAEWAILAEFEF